MGKVDGRCLAELTRKCLSGQLRELLVEAKEHPIKQFDRTFLQLYLSQATRYSHWPSIDFIWNRFVQKRQLLVVKPNVLCDIAKLSQFENKVGFTRSLLLHYNKFYRFERGLEWDRYKYRLLNVHIEMYSRKTFPRVSFKRKWHAFVTEVDNVLVQYPMSVWDWPNITYSLENVPMSVMTKWLFNDCKEGVLNDTSIPMLLNMILLQNHVTDTEKLQLLKEFLLKVNCDPSTHLQTTVQIFVHVCNATVASDAAKLLKDHGMVFSEKTNRMVSAEIECNGANIIN